MAFDLLITRPGGSAVSVKTTAGVESWDGVWMSAPWRGQDLTVPVRRGQTFAAQEYDAYTFSVPLVLLGSSQADFQDRLDTLHALVESSVAAVTVSRTKPSAGGDVTTFCLARARVPEVAAAQGLVNGKTALDVTNFDGCWYGTALTPTIPATITVPGTARTNRMTLVLPGTGTLSNTTLGVSVAVTAGQTLTVQSKQTTGTMSTITASGDPFGNWFTLAPGSNVITWSGSGTPTISYNPAYR